MVKFGFTDAILNNPVSQKRPSIIPINVPSSNSLVFYDWVMYPPIFITFTSKLLISHVQDVYVHTYKGCPKTGAHFLLTDL